MTDKLKLAIKAALLAGKEIIEVYHTDDFEVKLKSDESPLTIADQRAHNVINKILKGTTVPVLSEEGKKSDNPGITIG